MIVVAHQFSSIFSFAVVVLYVRIAAIHDYTLEFPELRLFLHGWTDGTKGDAKKHTSFELVRGKQLFDANSA